MKKLVRKWLGLPEPCGANMPVSVGGAYPIESPNGSFMNGQSTFARLTIYKASNGRIIEVGNYVPNPRGPDWTFEYHILSVDESLPEKINTIIAAKSLE